MNRTHCKTHSCIADSTQTTPLSSRCVVLLPRKIQNSYSTIASDHSKLPLLGTVSQHRLLLFIFATNYQYQLIAISAHRQHSKLCRDAGTMACRRRRRRRCCRPSQQQQQQSSSKKRKRSSKTPYPTTHRVFVLELLSGEAPTSKKKKHREGLPFVSLAKLMNYITSMGGRCQNIKLSCNNSVIQINVHVFQKRRTSIGCRQLIVSF